MERTGTGPPSAVPRGDGLLLERERFGAKTAKALKKGTAATVKVTFTFKPAGGGSAIVRTVAVKVSR